MNPVKSRFLELIGVTHSPPTQEESILLDTLTRTQEECTRLLLENRKLRDEIQNLTKYDRAEWDDS